MSGTLLTQNEADALLAMEKVKTNDISYVFPSRGGKLSIPIKSKMGREEFILDLSRRRIELARNKFQTRARKTEVLARVDLNDAPHRNPDGEEIPCPHIHIYREGFGDKWAFPLPPDKFPDPSDCWSVYTSFLDFCKIIDAPKIHAQEGIL